MSLKHLTLGERMVLAARLAAVEHIRQEADAAGVNLNQAARTPVVAIPVSSGEVASIRQDLFNQPAEEAALVGEDDEDERRAA